MEHISRFELTDRFPIVNKWFDDEFKQAAREYAKDNPSFVDTFSQLDYAQKTAERRIKRKCKALLNVSVIL